MNRLEWDDVTVGGYLHGDPQGDLRGIKRTEDLGGGVFVDWTGDGEIAGVEVLSNEALSAFIEAGVAEFRRRSESEPEGQNE